MPRPPRERPPWSDPAWHSSVEAWIDEQLESHGLQRTGPMAPRARPWSIVLEVPTSGGRTWFKSTAPRMANDAGLTPLLAATGSPLIVTPLATDPAHRWMLLPDVGERLRDRAEPGGFIEHWERILPAYAELQRSVEGRADELLEAGALDRRPARLAELLRSALDEPWWLRLDQADGLDRAQLDRVRGLSPRLAESAAELEAAGIGASIQNDDLHDGNVLVAADGDRIIDWGDACLAHPFGTLLVTLRSVGATLDLPEWTPFGSAPPELDRLRDAYLEPWTDRLPRDRLQRLVGLATWTGMLARVHAWRAALVHADDVELTEWRDAIPGWLGELAATMPGPSGS
jgi:hypothetical protein